MPNLDSMLIKMRLLGLISKKFPFSDAAIGRELLYRSILKDSAQAAGVSLPALYLVGGAANYSLLYTIFRMVTEMDIRSIVELGAGQSTLLLNALSVSKPISITTLEEDEFWSDSIRRKVSHNITHAPLIQKLVCGANTQTYSVPDEFPNNVELMIIDGPRGSKRRSRWGALDIADRCLGDEFIVVFDDAERRGEQDTAKKFFEMRPNLGYHKIIGTKHQIIFFTPKYFGVKFF